jgi:hypothetical protein
MTLVNLRDVKDEETIEDSAIETDPDRPDELIEPSPVPISQNRRLDVDAVLRRSLPRLTAEEL